LRISGRKEEKRKRKRLAFSMRGVTNLAKWRFVDVKLWPGGTCVPPSLASARVELSPFALEVVFPLGGVAVLDRPCTPLVARIGFLPLAKENSFLVRARTRDYFAFCPHYAVPPTLRYNYFREQSTVRI
jgi:hypothetical protein